MGYYSMPKYFQNMPTVGKALVNPNAENETEIKEIEKQIHDKVTEILAAGITTEEKLNERGQLSAMQRINALVDEGTFCPLNSLFNPNEGVKSSNLSISIWDFKTRIPITYLENHILKYLILNVSIR